MENTAEIGPIKENIKFSNLWCRASNITFCPHYDRWTEVASPVYIFYTNYVQGIQINECNNMNQH